MSKEKKPAKDWYVGATHWLTASFIMPLIFSFVGGVVLALLGVEYLIIFWLVSLVFAIIGIYVGIFYSIKFLKKTYIINNKISVLKYSTIFAVCQMVIGLGLGLYSVESETFVFLPFEFTLNVVSSLAILAAFYILSKKYISSIDTN